MKQDKNLVREILLHLEVCPTLSPTFNPESVWLFSPESLTVSIGTALAIVRRIVTSIRANVRPKMASVEFLNVPFAQGTLL
jgi:hypothetical protein